MLHFLLCLGVAYGFLEGTTNQIPSAALMANCTKDEANSIKMYYKLLMTCGYNMECFGNDDNNNNGRRRLNDQDQDFNHYEKYDCYCEHCDEYFSNLQTACNSCNSVNYCAAYDEDGMCQEEEDDGGQDGFEAEGDNFFQKYCVMDNLVVLAHGEDFCAMMNGASETCLTEMEYMINPPPEEEEDDDNNNNGRRRLNDQQEEGMVNAELLVECWASLFEGGSSYKDHEWCNWVCTQYANMTYDYMTNDIPTQTCGMQIDMLEDDAWSYDFLPEPVQHQSVMCVSSSCTETDLGYIAQYLLGMARYTSFVNLYGEEQDGNNNNNNNNQQDAEGMKQLKVVNRIPETRGAWKCGDPFDSMEEGAGGAGKISNDNFEDDNCDNNDNGGGSDGSSGGSKWATAATFAIICGLGMAVFMCLFLYYYRQTVALKTGQTRPLAAGQGTAGPPAASGVSYQEVRPHV